MLRAMTFVIVLTSAVAGTAFATSVPIEEAPPSGPGSPAVCCPCDLSIVGNVLCILVLVLTLVYDLLGPVFPIVDQVDGAVGSVVDQVTGPVENVWRDQLAPIGQQAWDTARELCEPNLSACQI